MENRFQKWKDSPASTLRKQWQKRGEKWLEVMWDQLPENQKTILQMIVDNAKENYANRARSNGVRNIKIVKMRFGEINVITNPVFVEALRGVKKYPPVHSFRTIIAEVGDITEARASMICSAFLISMRTEIGRFLTFQEVEKNSNL